MKPFLSRLLGGATSLSDAPVGPDDHYSVILRRRLGHWKQHTVIKTRIVRDEIERLRHYNEKVNAYAFVRSLGIPCPAYTEYPNVALAMAANADSPRFVLKPAVGHSSNGVFLLTRNADGSLQCHMTQRKFANNDELVDHYDRKQKLSSKFDMSEQVIVEEFVEDAQGHAVPLDYKVYAFRTGAAMILQKHGPLHMEKRDRLFNFYDAKGTLLQNIRDEPGGERRRSINPPASFKELIDVSNKIVKAMDVSFIRLDFFLTTKGIYFGECTPLPNLGKKAFHDEYEAILGRHWANSLKVMGIDYRLP
jgi:hypothetical protein